MAALILIPVLTRTLDPSEFGVFDVSMTFMFLAATVASFGLDPALTAFYFESKQPEDQKAVASAAVSFRLYSSLVVSALVFILAPLISQVIFATRAYADCIRLVSGIIPCFLFVGIMKQLFRVNFSPAKFNVLGAGNAALYTGLACLLVVKMEMGVEGVLIAAFSAGIVFALLGALMAKNIFSFRLSGSSLKGMLLFGLPLVPSLVAYWIIDFSDRYFLSRMATLDAVGIYSVGVKVASIIILFVTSFQMAWAPYALNIQYEADAKRKYANAMSFFLVLSFAAAAVLSIFSKFIVMLLTRPDYYTAESVVFPLTLSAIAYGAYLVANISMIITRRTVFTSIAIGIGAIVNVVLNTLLIPRYQMMGAAIATLISYLTALLLIYMFAQRQYPIPYDLKRIGGVAFLSITAMALGAVVHFQQSFVADFLFRILLTAALLALLFLLFARRRLLHETG